MASLQHLASGQFSADGEHEHRCEECEARYTRDPTTGLEFGHLINCPNRPDEIPDLTESHSHIYQPDSDTEPDREDDGGVPA